MILFPMESEQTDHLQKKRASFVENYKNKHLTCIFGRCTQMYFIPQITYYCSSKMISLLNSRTTIVRLAIILFFAAINTTAVVYTLTDGNFEISRKSTDKNLLILFHDSSRSNRALMMWRSLGEELEDDLYSDVDFLLGGVDLSKNRGLRLRFGIPYPSDSSTILYFVGNNMHVYKGQGNIDDLVDYAINGYELDLENTEIPVSLDTIDQIVKTLKSAIGQDNRFAFSFIDDLENIYRLRKNAGAGLLILGVALGICLCLIFDIIFRKEPSTQSNKFKRE
mmetsp:Transcript_7905/g.9902  ORF Transcript_7905/g.9902 Transcript_7905/m.9902 type:complete len:280 (-) Transcript_7905:341-1180(-)